MTATPRDMHIDIDTVVVSGLPAVESRALVRELHAGLTGVFSGESTATALTRGSPRHSRAENLGRLTAARIAAAAGRS